MFKVSIWVLASQSVTVLQPAEKSYMPQPCMLVLLWDVFPCLWKTINRSFMHTALLLAMRMCFRMPSSESTSVPQENLRHLGHVS